MKLLIAALIVGLVFTTAGILWAQGCMTSGHHEARSETVLQPLAPRPAVDSCPLMADLETELRLAPDQARRVREIQKDALRAAAPYRDKVAAKENALAKALKAEEPDLPAILKLIGESQKAATELRQIMAAAQVGLKGVLTREQYARLPACPALVGVMDKLCQMQGQHQQHQGGQNLDYGSGGHHH